MQEYITLILNMAITTIIIVFITLIIPLLFSKIDQFLKKHFGETYKHAKRED
jgi:hypothetical protein